MDTFQIAVEIRAGRLPVRWEVRNHFVESDSGSEIGHVFWPQLESGFAPEADVEELEDADTLRQRLFSAYQSGLTEASALALLNRVGAWRLTEAQSSIAQTSDAGRIVSFVYRHRSGVKARLLPVTLDDMRRELTHWYEVVKALKKPRKLREALPGQLRAALPAPPKRKDNKGISDQWLFALEAPSRTALQMNLEWSGKDPRAVVAPVSACELLATAAWLDILGGSKAYICENCGTCFPSNRRRKHCRPACANAFAIRAYRNRLKAGQNDTST